MYIYVKSFVIARTFGSEWISPDISNLQIKAIYEKYFKAYLVVKDTLTDTEVNIDLEHYKHEYVESDLTIAQWLHALAGTVLKTIPVIEAAHMASVRYENAISTGYKYSLGRIGFPYPQNMTHDELHDLRIVRPNYPTNMRLLHTHCLLTVNGYFHQSDADEEAAWIVDGGKTAMKSRCSHTGILSFLDIGSVELVQITNEMISPLTQGEVLSEGLLIKLDKDLTSKSPIFFIGGYMIRPEPETFYQVGDSTWCLNLLGLPYFERVLESQKHLDLSSMELEHPDNHIDGTLNREQLLTDKTIRAYLTLSQSFIAIVDTPELYFNKVFVRNSNLPGMITAFQEPTMPLVMGYGKCVEYSKIQESMYWALRVYDEWYKQFVWQTAPTSVNQFLSSQYQAWKPHLRSQAFLLDIRGKKR